MWTPGSSIDDSKKKSLGLRFMELMRVCIDLFRLAFASLCALKFTSGSVTY